MAKRRIVDIGPFLEDLKKELKDLKGSAEALTVEEAAEDEIEDLKKLPVIDPERIIPAWRNPNTDPPKVETEVLVLYSNGIDGYGITTAHYEDGNVLLQDSAWYWEDLPDWGDIRRRKGRLPNSGRLVGIPTFQSRRCIQQPDRPPCRGLDAVTAEGDRGGQMNETN